MSKISQSLKFLIILSFISAVIISACSVNELNPNLEIDPRLEFIDGKTDFEIKEVFINSSFNEQKEFWKSKLSQITQTEISNQQKSLISSLLEEFENVTTIEELKNLKVQELAISLAAITPREDFLNMFTNLRNFEPSILSDLEVCHECLESLVNDWDNGEPIFENNGRMMAKCNCKWTCNINFTTMDNKVTTDCTSTDRGCGFLLVQSCNKRSDLQ